MSRDPIEIKREIEKAERDLARALGEDETLARDVETSMARLRSLLGCEEGKEKEALEKLGAKIKDDTAEIERLLAEIPAAGATT